MGQSLQSACVAPCVDVRKVPAAQADGVDVATGQYLPAGHATQLASAVAPVVARYVPEGHEAGVTVPATQ